MEIYSSSQNKAIFLTGATGVLGAELLKKILEDYDHHIYCLIRADSKDVARERLSSFLEVYDPDGELKTEFNHRVQVVLGDVVLERFGLDEVEYESLTKTIDVTIHAASCTNLFLTMRRIEPINVGGIKNILKFVLQTKRKYISYISTYTVMGDRVFDPCFTFKECHLDVGQSFNWMTYQQTKFIAENLIRQAQVEGLNWNVIRPGQIFGESHTGRYPRGQTNVSGLFLDIFKTIMETGIAFESNTQYDVTPVDYVSKAILYLTLKREKYFETYHLTNPDIKTYSDVVQLVSSIGYPIESVTQEKYKYLLFNRQLKFDKKEYKSPTTQAFKWWLQKEPFDFTKSAITDCNYTYEILKSSGIECPTIDQKLIHTYIEEGIRQKYFPSPTIKKTFPKTELAYNTTCDGATL
jgi:thioester reductase-like protein